MKNLLLILILFLFNTTIFSNVYIVKPGDTLSEICYKNLGSSKLTSHIAHLNNIENIDLIYVGQKIILKTNIISNTSDVKASHSQITKTEIQTKENINYVKHKVLKDETLSHIAFKYYNTTNPKTIEKIMKSNNLTNHIIYPDMMLNIPKVMSNVSKDTNKPAVVDKEFNQNDTRLISLIKILNSKLKMIRDRRIQHEKIVKIMKENSFDTSYIY